MRYWTAILLLSAVGSAAVSHAAAASRRETQGRTFFADGEFKQATRAFEKDLARHPESAALHYWLGKSYARLAEISGPLSAPGNARKARCNLEQAVAIEPRNQEYVRELFDFYLDSPQWFHGGLSQAAALLERVGSVDPEAESALRLQLSAARKEYAGAGWWTRRVVLWTSGTLGRLVPQLQP